MQNALKVRARCGAGLRVNGFRWTAAALLSLLALSACVPPVDQEDDPEVPEFNPGTYVYEYTVTLVSSGETLAEGCLTAKSTQYPAQLAQSIQVAIPLEQEYRVDLRVTVVSGTSDAPDADARYCAMAERRPVRSHFATSCYASVEPLLHELTAVVILDEEGNSLPESDQGRFTYEEPATNRYQLISHQTGRVVLDLSNGPCAPTESNYPHDLFALLTVLEVSSQ